MPNLASLLKSEIARLARKEIRAEVSSLKKASSQHRSTIAALRREIEALKKQARKAPRQASAEAEHDDGSVSHRFRVDGLISHRKKLELSAEDYGKLVGVTGQSIYKWEAGRRPRAAQLEALAAVRGMGKREAAKRLEQLAAAAPKPAAKKTRQRR